MSRCAPYVFVFLFLFFSVSAFSGASVEAKLCKGPPVHLTFDDGPSEINTPEILRILKENKVPATFFILLDRINNNKNGQDLVGDILNSGQNIGLHGYSHDNFEKKTPKQIKDAFRKMDEVLREVMIDGQPLSDKILPLIRLPYGEGWVNESRKMGTATVASKLSKARLIELELTKRDWNHMGWNIETDDYELNDTKYPGMSSDAVISKTLEQLKERHDKGGVVLLHDTHKTTLQMLPTFILKLKQHGYCFVGIDQFREDLSLDIVLPRLQHVLPYTTGQKCESGIFGNIINFFKY